MTALFLLWVAFNGRLTVEVALLGLCLCALMAALLNRAMGYSVKRELKILARMPEIMRYFALLTWEVIKSSLAVARVILSKDAAITSQLKFFTPDLSANFARALLGNSITLTPGTITVQLKNGRYCVHTIRDEFIADIENSALTKGAARLEARLK